MPVKMKNDEGQEVEVASMEEYNQVLEQLQSAASYADKAKLLDELLEDPKFHEYLAGDEAASTAATSKPAVVPGAPKEVMEQLTKVLEPITKRLDQMEQMYTGDKQEFLVNEATREVEAMAADKTNFPFYDAVRDEMTKLLTSGRAVNLVDAYRIASFDKAKAAGRDETLRKGRNSLLSPSDGGSETPSQFGKKSSLREKLEQAADQVGTLHYGNEE